MSLQTSIAQYFSSRKRRAVDEIKKVSNSNKVLILDKNITDVSLTKETNSSDGEGTDLKRTVIYNDSPKIVKPKNLVVSAPKLQRKTPKTLSGRKKKEDKEDSKQSDIRKSLLASFNATLENTNLSSEQEDNTRTHEKEQEFTSEQCSKINVPFIIKGFLSPKKEFNTRVESPIKSSSVPSTSKKSNDKKESLKSIRSKLINSSRLDEIKKSLKNIDEGRIKLKQIGENLCSKKPSESPSLKKFSTINIEVCSPTKRVTEPICSTVPSSPSLLRRSVLMSPGKTQSGSLPYVSPRKLFLEASPTKSFEKFSHLSTKEKLSLILPYKYRALAETFRAVDAVISMLFNRNETVLFSKLKASVQQMSKKSLTETHLGQILTIYPNAFTFHQEKIRQGPGLPNKYELSIRPVLENTNVATSSESKEKNESTLMSPSIILERRRKMYAALLDLTKDHHQKFLLTLDPPMILDKNKVTRWHPEFDVDSVPDIDVSPLPLPPNVEKFSSAKDVLNKARDIFMCNPRMALALEKNSVEQTPQCATRAAASIPALTSALKGIPKSLLEKVRAKQAAKAASILTRNPEAVKRRVEYSRLTEISRIVRNTFIAEKKAVLPKSIILEKLINSYREILTPNDMEHHLNLLLKTNPDWLTMVDNQRETYLKILKELDLTVIHENISKLINQI